MKFVTFKSVKGRAIYVNVQAVDFVEDAGSSTSAIHFRCGDFKLVVGEAILIVRELEERGKKDADATS